ncbi:MULTISPECIES: 30S ribosomal protein S4 [Acidiplasma]|jgi:small subunit ribosomal protein S4|uniref:Small ribosomal subunit protein uS4 n=2 Tax=Acidiplasma TaxID=507753 RepID=A0A0Q0RVZ1_9ARCH|nr:MULTISPECIES: 30S ribosomal protein S4 [Acidiplasma]KJE49397.1 30S ribosomal protein S4 [Acidiplasma sp. MBA-1]KPV46917.1 30S ribosomal protein S4 [Acidiplasma aeolicum]KQB34702.1 30S ribosomal protein S4 [Acidiplasma aeolicum]KQB36563.1 30S ribosomal protein S4 [Acidiplasma cupricumulans]WMT54648.1 MAG: 30S ribosomal protein S4 [Acidiplasma sp.]
MGDQKFQRKSYSTPRHPWEKERIDYERELLIKYGLKNKRELWKAEAILNNFRTQARSLQAKIRYSDPLAQKQLQQLLAKLSRLNILTENATLDDILALSLEDILDRRLQTIVYQKNFASTMKQARQLIVHGHITVNGRVTTIPSMFVQKGFEDNIAYSEKSPFADENHPIRLAIAGAVKEEQEEDKKENVKEEEDE